MSFLPALSDVELPSLDHLEQLAVTVSCSRSSCPNALNAFSAQQLIPSLPSKASNVLSYKSITVFFLNQPLSIMPILLFTFLLHLVRDIKVNRKVRAFIRL